MCFQHKMLVLPPTLHARLADTSNQLIVNTCCASSATAAICSGCLQINVIRRQHIQEDVLQAMECLRTLMDVCNLMVTRRGGMAATTTSTQIVNGQLHYCMSRHVRLCQLQAKGGTSQTDRPSMLQFYKNICKMPWGPWLCHSCGHAPNHATAGKSKPIKLTVVECMPLQAYKI